MKSYPVLLLFPLFLFVFVAEPVDIVNGKSYCFFGSFTFQNLSRECYAVEGLYTWKSCCCDLLGESWGPRCENCPHVTSDEFTSLCKTNINGHIVINHLLPSILSAAPPVPDILLNDCSIDVPGTSSMATNSQAQAAFKTCCCENGSERVRWQSKYFSCPAYGLDTYHFLCGSPIDVEVIEDSIVSIQSDSSQVVVIGPCFKSVRQVKADYWACSEAMPGEFSHTECCCQQDARAWGDECQSCEIYSQGRYSAMCAGRLQNPTYEEKPVAQKLAESSSNISPDETEGSSTLETSTAALDFIRDYYKVDILQVEGECYINQKSNSTGLFCFDAIPTNMTLADCCCLIGQGWGSPCQKCPDTNSRLFSELCMAAQGFGAAHRDVPTENRYPIPPFMSSESASSLSVMQPPVVLAPETESLSTLVGFDLCYELVYFNNDTAVCGLVMTYLLTYTECCCDYPGIGRGWGQDCLQCPLTNTNEFDDMCGFSVSFDHSTYISFRPEIPIPDENSNLFGCYGSMMVKNTSYDAKTQCTNNMLAARSSELDCCCLLIGESWGVDCIMCPHIGTDDFALLCDEDYREAVEQVPIEVPLYERCYASYNDSKGGHCEGILHFEITWQQCCCMAYGKAWGGSCFPCPPIGTESYKSMCNVPLISIDYDPSDLCRRDNCSPGHCEVLNGNTEVCFCPIGYKQAKSRKGLVCQDVDECMLQQGLCEPGACFNTLGSYYCFCPDGFAHFQGEEHCRDLNECASIGDQCNPGYCVNLEGSFECRCPIGFYYNMDQVMCDDFNECSVNVMLCYPGICLNTDGSFKCVCPYNYEYDIRRQLCIPKSKFTSIAIMIPSIPERQHAPEPADKTKSQPDKAIGKVSALSKGVTTDGNCNEIDLMPNLADICKPSVRVNVTLEFIVKHNVTNNNEELWLRKLMELHFKTEINVMVVKEIEGKPHDLTHPWEVKKFSAFVSEMCTQLHVVHTNFETIVDHIRNNSKTQVYFSLTVIRASFSEYVDETGLEMNCDVSKHNYSETYFIESGYSSFIYISANNILYVPSQVQFEKVHRFSESGNSCQETSLYVCSNEENLEHCPPLILNSTISLNATRSTSTDNENGDTSANQSMLHPRGRPDVCSSLKRDNNVKYMPPSFFPKYSDHMQVTISCIGILLSLVALTITFTVRCLFRSLRTLLGKILMNLIGALFIGQLGVLLQGQGVTYPPLCTTIAAIMHYVWLAAFFWMNAMAMDFFFTFGSKVKLRKRHSKRKILQAYMFYGWGAPLPIIILCLVIHFGRFHNLRFRYGSEFACWIYDEKSTLLAFGLPLMIILFFNILLFICAVIGLRLTKVNKVGDVNNSRLKRFKTDLLVYVKMSTLMGFTWIFGFISAFTELEIFRYIFIILNSLQGVFIFMAFTCNKHVRKEVKRCLNRGLQNAGRDQRKSSAGKFNSSEATRQSEEPVKGTLSKLTHL
ncbi:fibrillin-1-like [Anneissia japonica]|uniref:fibrillin-1-like n=1 Tax=Anneissia japonica TaxID=1529436 RepID=UPI0014255305|nr:fibrillin-1-like [Anneissia japonica]